MTTLLAAFVITVWGTWFALTVVNAIPRLSKAVLSRLPAPVIHLIPTWTFFAPNPATTDQCLAYRDIYSDGSAGSWRVLWPFEDRPSWSFLFDPHSRSRKAVSDLTTVLSRYAREVDDKRLVLSVPYLMILTRIVGAARGSGAPACQFALVATNLRRDNVTVVFRSAVHQLTGDVPRDAEVTR